MEFMKIKHAEQFFNRKKIDSLRSVSRPVDAAHSPRRRAAMSILSIAQLTALAGCSASPSINVLGAYFPDWIFSLSGGLLLTSITHALLGRLHRERLLGPPIIANTALLALFSLLIWLLIFNS